MSTGVRSFAWMECIAWSFTSRKGIVARSHVQMIEDRHQNITRTARGLSHSASLYATLSPYLACLPIKATSLRLWRRCSPIAHRELSSVPACVPRVPGGATNRGHGGREGTPRGKIGTATSRYAGEYTVPKILEGPFQDPLRIPLGTFWRSFRCSWLCSRREQTFRLARLLSSPLLFRW